MLSARAFRAQLVVQGQRALFDYWLKSAGTKPMPARSDLDPFSVPRLLPHLGLIDVSDGLDKACFRLAGTRLHDVYGQELTGKKVEQIFSGRCANYWQRAHARVIDSGEPVFGVIRGPVDGRDHIVLFWLRLPLSKDGSKVDKILCHDTAGPVETAHVMEMRPLRRYPPMQTNLTAAVRQARCG
jgi:hypothetical protein